MTGVQTCALPICGGLAGPLTHATSLVLSPHSPSRVGAAAAADDLPPQRSSHAGHRWNARFSPWSSGILVASYGAAPPYDTDGKAATTLPSFIGDAPPPGPRQGVLIP